MTLHRIITGLIIALGMLHVGFTPFNYGRFDMDAMWFLGSGLAIILAGFLNIAVIRGRGKDKLVWVLGLITNLGFAILFGIGLLLLTQPQDLNFRQGLSSNLHFRQFNGSKTPVGDDVKMR